MRVVLFGPPGAGKGTQAKKIAAAYKLNHLSTGDMFRSAIKHDNEVGREAKSYIEKGRLVPDTLVCEVAREALDEIEAEQFVLDGFPRTIPQSEWLDDYLGSKRGGSLHVVNMIVDDDIIVRRLSQRRMHRETGAIYNLALNPPPADVRPEDLIQRVDDRPESIRRRLVVYHEQTAPLEDYYRKSGRLADVDALGPIEDVFARIASTLVEPASVQ